MKVKIIINWLNQCSQTDPERLDTPKHNEQISTEIEGKILYLLLE